MNKFIVEQEMVGVRLDAYLAVQLADLSRSAIKKIVEDGCVTVNAVVNKKPALKVKLSDEIVVDVPIKSSELAPIKMPLNIIFEDEYILIINKPAGLVVHPTPANVNTAPTLVALLLAYLGDDLLQVGHPLRPGIVHRLDKDTSGIMVVAKTPVAYLELVKKFAQRELEKVYVTLVAGKMEHKKATINAPLERFLAGKKMVISGDGAGKPAVTHYFVMEEFRDSTLLQVDLETGRTHQIRLHMASIGHPVVGDAKYGSAVVNSHYQEAFSLGRQFLHANKLSFAHPISKKELSFEAPLSDDLQNVLTQLTSSLS